MNQMINDINEADLVLIGIGEQFRYQWHMLETDQRYVEIINEVEQKTEYEVILPYLYKFMLNKMTDRRLEQAYEKLEQLLVGKNYFIVSTEIDDYILQSGFSKDRIVTPCGGFRSLQCDDNCQNEIVEIPEMVMDQIDKYYHKIISIDEISIPTCSHCGKALVMNQMGVTKYCENGYLDQWKVYTKWLQGSMNRKLTILELGMGMQFPSVFRWPAEKLVFYNMKSRLYRIHSDFYQIGDEIKDRAVAVKADPISFLLELE